MPRALVEQAHPAAADGRQRRRDVRHPVPDVVHTLAPAGQDPSLTWQHLGIVADSPARP